MESTGVTVERILSQAEIDELLSAFDNGQIDAFIHSETGGRTAPVHPVPRNVSRIELTRGQNYSKWRIANLDIVFNSFARYYSIGLSNHLQQGVTVRKGEIVSRFFEDFLVHLNDAGVLGVFSLDPLKGNGLFVFNKQLCFGLVEVLFGMSAAHKFLVLDREVTAIEANIVRSLMAEGCQVLNRAFSALDQLNSSITRVETNAKLLNILAPETEVIQVSFPVQAGALQGEILMVLPYYSLEPFKERLRDGGFQSSQGTKEFNWAKQLEKEGECMEMNVSAPWGELTLTIQEILSLRDGDIISFDYDEAAPIKIMAGAKPKFTAQPGLRNGKKVVRLVKKETMGEN